MRKFHWKITGREMVKDIHPLAHMEFFRPGEEVCYEGTAYADDTSQMRQMVMGTYHLFKPWPRITELKKDYDFQPVLTCQLPPNMFI
jgi:hypothetical protein